MKLFLKSLLKNFVGLAALVIILITANVLAKKGHLRLDLTGDKEFTLAPSTRNILNGLEDQIIIRTYISPDLPAQMLPMQESLTDLIDEFRALAPKPVLVENVDPAPNEIKEQETQHAGIAPLQVNILEKDEQKLKKIYFGIEIFYRDKREVIASAAQVQNLEYEMALSLLKLTASKVAKIGYFIPEESAARFQFMPAILGDLSQATPLDFNNPLSLKDDFALVVVVDPRNLQKNFVDRLRDYVANGGQALIIGGKISVSENLATELITTGLESWYKEMGFTISEKLALDPTQNAQAAFQQGALRVVIPYPFWPRSFKNDFLENHPVTAELEEILMPWTNVIEIDSKKTKNISAEILVKTSPHSLLQEDETPSVAPDILESVTITEKPKAYPVIAEFKNKLSKFSGSLTVVSSTPLFEDRFLQQAPANALFLQNLVEYNTWGDKLIGVRSRGKTARPLKEISDNAKNLIKGLHIIGIPLFVILLAFIRSRFSRILLRNNISSL